MNKYLKKTNFNKKIINIRLKFVNKDLKKYIENNILPKYKLNSKGHDEEHINYVLNRSFEFNINTEINYDILFTCVCFHDIACYIDRNKHEILSAEMAFNDAFLNNYFDKEEMKTIYEAIEDHRASLEYTPRNIYGKILSSADRKIEIREYLITSMSFEKNEFPNKSKEEIIEASYNFAIKKFGHDGYAINKMYIDDEKYKKFLMDIQYIINHKEIFNELANIIYEEI